MIEGDESHVVVVDEEPPKSMLAKSVRLGLATIGGLVAAVGIPAAHGNSTTATIPVRAPQGTKPIDEIMRTAHESFLQQTVPKPISVRDSQRTLLAMLGRAVYKPSALVIAARDVEHMDAQVAEKERLAEAKRERKRARRR